MPDQMPEDYDQSVAVEANAGLSSESWARRLQRGDPVAAQVVRLRVRKILTHRAMALAIGEREDLEQDVMTDIWQAVNRSQFDFSGGFWGFVEVVTSRRCIDLLRTRKDEPELPEVLRSSKPGPLMRTLARERAELASEVLSSLDPECRRLVGLRLTESLSYREIGEIMGKTEGALRVRLYRCIREARVILKRLVHSGQDSGGRGSGS